MSFRRIGPGAPASERRLPGWNCNHDIAVGILGWTGGSPTSVNTLTQDGEMVGLMDFVG